MKKLTRKFFRNRKSKSAFRFGKHPLSRFSMESLFSNMSDSMVPIDSLTSPDYTWSWSKISCLRSMYFAHVFWCYIVFLAGIGCMLTRLWQGPPAWRLHSWFGYWYIISMLWATATSMLIHNTGLPPAVLVSFIWCLGGLTIGWFLIRLHMAKMDAAAFEVVKEEIMSGKASDVSLPAALAKHKAARKRHDYLLDQHCRPHLRLQSVWRLYMPYDPGQQAHLDAARRLPPNDPHGPNRCEPNRSGLCASSVGKDGPLRVGRHLIGRSGAHRRCHLRVLHLLRH